MKGLDVLIVRFAPFILFGIFGTYLLYSFNNIDITDAYKLHGNSAIYATCLFLISLSNKKYHCVYNRVMYIFLIVIPLINYLNAKFNLFPDKETHVLFVVIATILTTLITAYLAIKHFINISKRKLKNGSNQ
jgi:hypothetical protein